MGCRARGGQRDGGAAPAGATRGSTSPSATRSPQLAAQPDLNRSEESREHQRRTFREPLLALIARGQRAGEFSTALSPEWAARAFGALLLAGARAVADGALSHEDAPGVVFATLLDGLRA